MCPMRKIRIAGFGLFAVLVLCMLNVAPAFAESEWLVEKAKVETTLNAETEGDLTLVIFSSGVLTEILCSLIFDGTIKEKVDTILDILSLEHGITVGSLGDANEEFLNCEVTFEAGGLPDCKEKSLALVWFDGLNLELEDWWLTEILLVSTQFFDDILELNNLGEPVGIEYECETLIGVFGSELCELKRLAGLLTNSVATSPASVLDVVSLGEAGNRGNCTAAGEHAIDFRGEFNMWAIGAELERLETEVS